MGRRKRRRREGEQGGGPSEGVREKKESKGKEEREQKGGNLLVMEEGNAACDVKSNLASAFVPACTAYSIPVHSNGFGQGASRHVLCRHHQLLAPQKPLSLID